MTRDAARDMARDVGRDAKASLARAFRSAVDACHPRAALAGRLPPAPSGRVLLLGAGKPAAAMAVAAEDHYLAAGVEVSGVVVVPYGHGVATRRVEVLEASHPFPDRASVAAADRLLALADRAGRGDSVVCLIGGGGSALLCAPAGVSLDEKVALTRQLLASGAAIGEINAVRKHLSRVKGGGLAARLYPATAHSLAISDVVGDDPGTIAAGPTVADPSTFADALAVLERYRLDSAAGRAALEAGARGEAPETLKPGDPSLATSTYELVASNATALAAAEGALAAAGYAVEVRAAPEVGEARDAAASRAREVAARLAAGGPLAPTALLSGGEVTVTLGGGASGSPASARPGGPNCEYALAFAAALRAELGRAVGPEAVEPALARVCLLSADSDGIDGASGAAGALFGPGDLARLGEHELRGALESHASREVLESHGAAFVTGPTLTNVNDLRFVLLLPKAP